MRPIKDFAPIHMPKNTPAGVVLSGLALAFGFAMIWYIWWLAALSFLLIVAYAIWHTFDYDWDYYIPVETVIEEEDRRTQALAAGA